MPQEFVLLQCFSCKMYQVHIKNKLKKFQCKVCGEKQSYKHLFAISNQAKDLRILCGEYNEKRILNEEEEVKKKIEDINNVEINDVEEEEFEVNDEVEKKESLWKEFEEEKQIEEGDLFKGITTTTPQEKPKRKFKKTEERSGNDIKEMKPKKVKEEMNNIDELLSLFENGKDEINEVVGRVEEKKPIKKPKDIIDKQQNKKNTKKGINILLDELKKSDNAVEDHLLFVTENEEQKTTHNESVWDDF